jgi:hypothetical protein
MKSLVPLAKRTELVPRSTRSALAPPPRQLDLTLDHARLWGMPPIERQTVIAQLARLLLEARGIVMREVDDDHT